MNESYIYGKWIKYIDRFQELDTDDSFKSVKSLYEESAHHYHNLTHIEACLKHLETLKESVDDLFCLESAIWFHDVIYDPTRSDNEECSAKYAREFLEAIDVDKDAISKVEHLILLTKHPSKPVTDDEKILIDIDLSILGSPEEIYDRYTKQIRQEYSFVPQELYAKGRGALLKEFLSKPFIYETDYFRDNFRTPDFRENKVIPNWRQ